MSPSPCKSLISPLISGRGRGKETPPCPWPRRGARRGEYSARRRPGTFSLAPQEETRPQSLEVEVAREIQIKHVRNSRVLAWQGLVNN